MKACHIQISDNQTKKNTEMSQRGKKHLTSRVAERIISDFSLGTMQARENERNT